MPKVKKSTLVFTATKEFPFSRTGASQVINVKVGDKFFVTDRWDDPRQNYITPETAELLLDGNLGKVEDESAEADKSADKKGKSK